MLRQVLTVENHRPLINTFGSPFDERPVIPEFTLPQAYTVTNVPPLASKMDSFSDETLIMIFYQYPRDILQELAAQTLYKRDWRWHKELRQWMMKDQGMGGPPVRISDKQERGWYIFFDVGNWRRERREFVLNYEHLDARSGLMNASAGSGLGANGPPAANINAAFAAGVGGIGSGGLAAGYDMK